MILKDEKLGKYEVHLDGSNYSVIERTGINKKGDDVFKTHAYCSSMESAISKIIRMKVENNDNVHSLESYLKELKSQSEQLNKAFKLN